MTLAKLSNNWFPSVPSIFDRFLEGDLMGWDSMNYTGQDSTLPAVNVTENNNEFLIDVAAPGMSKDDFKVNYENGRLAISAETKTEKKEKTENKVTRREFSYQSFQRSFTVSEQMVNTDKIEAHYKDGILHISIPKRDEVKPKPPKAIKIS